MLSDLTVSEAIICQDEIKKLNDIKRNQDERIQKQEEELIEKIEGK